MAADAVATESTWQKLGAFVREAYHEIRFKTTWPDMPQVRQASIAIIVFVLLVGLLITLLDLVLRGVLVNWLPSILR